MEIGGGGSGGSSFDPTQPGPIGGTTAGTGVFSKATVGTGAAGVPGGNTIGGLYVNGDADYQGILPPANLSNVFVQSWMKGVGDHDERYVFQAGTTQEARSYLDWLDHLGNERWLMGKNGTTGPDAFILYDSWAGGHRMYMPSAADHSGGPTYIASMGNNPVIINGNNNVDSVPGTAGLSVRSGGATPVEWLSVNNSLVSVRGSAGLQVRGAAGVQNFGVPGDGLSAVTITPSTGVAPTVGGLGYGLAVGVPSAYTPGGFKTAALDSTQPDILDLHTGSGLATNVGIQTDNAVASLNFGVVKNQLSINLAGASASHYLLSASLLTLGGSNRASPLSFALQVGGSSRPTNDTNVSGANGVIQSGNGTGNATPSTLNLQTPVAVAGGAGAQTQTTQVAINSTGVTVTPPLVATKITLAGVLVLTSSTVATLPSATLSGSSARSTASDASSPTFAAAVAGGGATPIPVFSDGSAWRVG